MIDQYSAEAEAEDPTMSPAPAEIDMTQGIPNLAGNPMEDEMNSSWDAIQERVAEKRQAWSEEKTKSVYEALRNPTEAAKKLDLSYATDKDAEFARTAVHSYLVAQNPGIKIDPDDTSIDYARTKIAMERFKGEGAASNEEFYGVIKGESKKYFDKVDFHKEFATRAMQSSFIPGKEFSYEENLAALKKHPGYDDTKQADYYKAWAEAQTEYKAMNAGSRKQVNEVLLAFKSIGKDEGFDRGDPLKIATDALMSVPEEDFPAMVHSIRMMAETLPETEKYGFFEALGTAYSRNVESFAMNAGEMVKARGLEQLSITGGQVLPDDARGAMMPRVAKEESERVKAAATAELADYKQLLGRRAIVKQVFQADYDTIEGSPVGKFLGSALGTTTTSLPSAAIPFYGGAMMYASMEGAARESLYLKGIEAGLTEKQSIQYADDLKAVSAIPQAIVESISNRIVMRGAMPKGLKWIDSALDKVDDLVANRVGRFFTKVALITGEETVTETGQDLTESLVQDIANVLNEQNPDINWGKELQGAWTNAPNIAGEMIFLSMIGAAGGANPQAQQRAWSKTSDLAKRAHGYTPDAIARLNSIQSPSEFSRTWEEEYAKRDPFSDDAKAAVAEREEAATKFQELLERRATAQAQVDDPRMPKFIHENGSYSVVDKTTGETIGKGLSTRLALDIAQSHFSMMEKMSDTELSELASILSISEGKVDKGGKVEISPYESVNTEEAAKRFGPGAEEAIYNEMLLNDKGEESSDNGPRPVFGVSLQEFKNNNRRTVNKILNGGSVFTVFHEEAHGFLEEAKRTGRLTDAGVVDFLKHMDEGLTDKLLPADFDDLKLDDPKRATAIKEGVSEFMESQVLQSRKRGTKISKAEAALINTNLMAAIQNRTGLIGKTAKGMQEMIAGAKKFFGLAFARAAQTRAGIRSGKIDQAKVDAFVAALYGMDLQEEFDAKVDEELKGMLGIDTPPAFSIGSPSPAPFYSQLSRTIEAKMPKSATPEQVLQIARAGSKAEEIKWSGIEQALPGLAVNGKVSKEAVLTYMETEGQVRFEEVVIQKPKERDDQIDQSPEEIKAELGLRGYFLDSEYGETDIRDRNGELVDFEDIDSGTQNLLRQYEEALTEDQQLGDDAEMSRPRYWEYTLPGGENYREIVLTKPTPVPSETSPLDRMSRAEMVAWHQNQVGYNLDEDGGSSMSDEEIRQLIREYQDEVGDDMLVGDRVATGKSEYTSSHFPRVPNYVAHTRLTDRTDPEGRPGLFVEEFQSDRHQEARKVGYSNDEATDENIRKFFDLVEGADPADHREDYLAHPDRKRAIPDAPFRKDWSLALFKRALRDAVESGKDWIGWTTGETQNDRFDIGKKIDSLNYGGDVQDGWTLHLIKDNDILREMDVKDSELEATVGKDVAARIREGVGSIGNGMGTLEGLDLKVGGDGMKGFYDNILPKEIGKYVKQWGAKVEQSSIGANQNWRISEQKTTRGTEFVAVNKDSISDQDNPAFKTRGEAEAFISSKGGTPIWRVDITPEMREGVRLGQPAFSIGKIQEVISNLDDPADIRNAISEQDAISELASIIADSNKGDIPKEIADLVSQAEEAIENANSDWGGRDDLQEVDAALEAVRKFIENSPAFSIGSKPIGEISDQEWDILTEDLVDDADTFAVDGNARGGARPAYEMADEIQLFMDDARNESGKTIIEAWDAYKKTASPRRKIIQNLDSVIRERLGRPAFSIGNAPLQPHPPIQVDENTKFAQSESEPGGDDINDTVTARRAFAMVDRFPGLVIDTNGNMNAAATAFSIGKAEQWGDKFLKDKEVLEMYGEKGVRDFMRGVMNILSLPGFMDLIPDVQEGEDGLSPLRKNSDQYGETMDITANCPKQDDYVNAVRDIESQFNRILSPTERFVVGVVLKEYGGQGVCWYCYGQAGRDAWDKAAARMVDIWNEVGAAYKAKGSITNEEMKAIFGTWTVIDKKKGTESLFAKTIRANLDKGIVLDPLRTRDMMRGHIKPANDEEAKLIKSLVAVAQAAQKANKPKGYAPYWNQLLGKTKPEINRQNNMNGFRMNSQTDFRIWHIIEVAQWMTHMAKIGGKAHVFTRQPEFLEIFGSTGLKFNLSIDVTSPLKMPKLSVTTTNRNGKKKREKIRLTIEEYKEMYAKYGDPDWGMDCFPEDQAKAFRKKHKNDVGLMLVAIDDYQLWWALENDQIDMVIPYHAGAVTPAINEVMDANDFSHEQHEKGKSKITLETFSKATGISIDDIAAEVKAFKGTFYKPVDGKPDMEQVMDTMMPTIGVRWHKNNAQTYLDLCEALGITPKFERFSKHKGYIKLLRDASRNPDQQQVVDPTKINWKKAYEYSSKWVDQGGDRTGKPTSPAMLELITEVMNGEDPLTDRLKDEMDKNLKWFLAGERNADKAPAPSFSIGPASMAGGLMEAAQRRMMKSPEYKQAFFDNLLKRLAAIQSFIDTRGTAFNFDSFGEEFKGKFSDEKEATLNALAMFEAIVKSLPIDLRGRVPGALTLAKQDTEEKRLEYLKNRVKKASAVIDKWVSRESDRAMLKLMQRSMPTKGKPGEKPKGKAGPQVHDLFIYLRGKMGESQEKIDGEILSLESQLASGQYDAEEETLAQMKLNLVGQVGNWKEATAARKHQAVREATSVFEAGYYTYRLQKLLQAEERAIQRKEARKSSKGTGSIPEMIDKLLADNGLKGTWRANLIGLLPFEEIMNVAFGRGSSMADYFARLEMQANDRKHDWIRGRMIALEQLFTDLAGGNALKGEKLRYKLANEKTIEVNGVKLTQFEAIGVTMMWRQADGRRHMEGHKDGDGKPAGEWHFDQNFVDAVEKEIMDEAKEVRSFLTQVYAGEHAEINPLFVKMNGINLPQNFLYSPITVKPQKVAKGDMADPTTGFAMSQGNGTPGSLRTRGASIAKPDFRDAVQTFISHTQQIGHWLGYAEMVDEYNAILNNREVIDSIEGASGAELADVIGKWGQYFTQGGSRDAASSLALNRMISRMMGRMMGSILIGRVGVLAIQSTQLGASLAEMSTGAYLFRLGKLLTFQLEFKQAINSRYIQRRMESMPVAIQEIMRGIAASKPSMTKHLVQKLGRLIGGMDALMTAGTYAMVLDKQMKMGKKANLEGDALETFAHSETVRIVDRIAQPVRPGARSIYENLSTSPWVRMSWSFASEARQKLALGIWRTMSKDYTKAEATRALATTWLVGGFIATLIRSALRDIKDDEDEFVFDEKNWDPTRLALATMTGPLSGMPLIGEALEAGIWKATGEYLPEGNMFSSIAKAIDTAFDVDTWTSTEPGDILKNAEILLSGAAATNDSIAAAASLSHLARDIYRIANTDEENP